MAGESFLETVSSLASQIEEASKIEPTRLPVGNFHRIVFCGIGGSAIAADIIKAYMRDSKVPVFVSRGYEVPEFVNRETLVFVLSYSGNTEETLSAYRSAYRKGAAIVALTSGGKLMKKCEEQKDPLIKVPGGLQPRASIAYQLIPILKVLYRLKLIPNPSNDIFQTVAALRKTDYKAQSKNLAGKLLGRVPIIYASEVLSSV